MADLCSHRSIMALNANGLNIRTKRQRLAEWIKNYKQLHAVYNKFKFVVGTSFQYNNIEVESKRMEKDLSSKR